MYAGGWERRPAKPNRSLEVIGGANGMGESPGPATAECYVPATPADHPNVRLQTMTATDGVVSERPARSFIHALIGA